VDIYHVLTRHKADQQYPCIYNMEFIFFQSQLLLFATMLQM